MRYVDQAIVEKSGIYIIYRNPYLRSIVYRRPVKCLRIDDILRQYIRDLPLQYLISLLLQLHVNTEVHIFSRPRFFHNP